MAVTLRHLRLIRDGSETGAAVDFLGGMFEPDAVNVNGDTGFQEGDYETRIYEDGAFSVTFPNIEGPDTIRHLERFSLTSTDNPEDDGLLYRPGEDWIEIYDEGDLMYVGTPVRGAATRNQIALSGNDPLYLLRLTREYFAGYWNHAPRDVFEHYTKVWSPVLAEDFQGGSLTGRFVTSETLTSDTPAIAPGRLRIRPPTGGFGGVIRGHGDYAIPVGTDSSAKYDAWQVKATYTRPRFGSETDPPYGGNAQVRVGLWDVDADDELIWVQLQERVTYLRGPQVTPFISGTDVNVNARFNSEPPGPTEVIVEGRERWVYFFVNQTLIGVIPMPAGPYDAVPFVAMVSGSGGIEDNHYCDVDNIVFRRTRPFLMRGTKTGDYHLAGEPPPGGLYGHYFNDTDLHNDDQYAVLTFAPTREPTALRLDPTLNFPRTGETNDPPDWGPEGAFGKTFFTIRWTGSIRLNLEDEDYRLRIRTDEEGARVWVAKTRFGEQYVDNWFFPDTPDVGTFMGSFPPVSVRGDSLRDHIGENDLSGDHVNGWYPILIEYGQRDIAGASFHLEWSIDGGSWETVPVSKLSPFGIFNEHIRLDSHFEALRTLADEFGCQYTVEPHPLEHSAFPGELLPRRKVGRDSDKIIGNNDVESSQVNLDAADVADSILGSGASLSDTGGDQLTVEAINHPDFERRLLIVTQNEDWGDIGYEPLLQQRVTTMLALRSSPWEEVAAQPPSFRELTDTFPLTGNMATLDWKAGDGVRLNFPALGVVDSSPRQILGVVRPFYPVALRAASISFKQRPRGMREFIRQMQRRYLNRQRNYQNQYVVDNGNAGRTGRENEVRFVTSITRRE